MKLYQRRKTEIRTLLLFRGAPGCGKSTFIKQHDIENYTLSADDIRIKLQSTSLMPDGTTAISVNRESDVWSILFNMLEIRMKNGQFTVVDATNSKTSEMNKYKEIAKKYRYMVYIIDMTGIPIDQCKMQNRQRTAYKIVPNEAIEKMYARFETQNIPKSFTVIKPNEFDKILYKPLDFSQYKKIHHIGDIHGCNTVLQEYLKDGFKEDELYIFCGDYLDRGLENIEVLKFLLSIYSNKNVVLLEGNHENSLRNWSSGLNDYSKNFRDSTLNELDNAFYNGEISKKEVRQLCGRLSQMSYYTYNGKTLLVCHGGISGFKENLLFVSTNQLIKGVGRYDDYMKVAESFEKNTSENTYMINGHRNITGESVHCSKRCFNLEGAVERGGHLRVATLSKDGFETFEIKNDIFLEENDVDERDLQRMENKPIHSDVSIEELITCLRTNRFIKERVQGNISSFNFTRNAFDNKIWNDQTVRARGLFINTKDNYIQSRGYTKFFNINERDETRLFNLKYKFKFPVTAYVKENGFLGMISYDKENDGLLFATKSVLDTYSEDGDIVNILRSLYYTFTSKEQQQNLKDYLLKNNKTILVEVVDNENDPHIIKYDKKCIYLLDIIENSLETNKEEYDILKPLSNKFGLLLKEKINEFNNWNEFYKWYLEVTDEDYKYNDKYIEGFVLEDSNKYMVKLKLHYYKYWKMLRGVTKQYIKTGQLRKTGMLYNAEANHYFGYLKLVRDDYIYVNTQGKICTKDYNFIEIRDEFYDYMKRKK